MIVVGVSAVGGGGGTVSAEGHRGGMNGGKEDVEETIYGLTVVLTAVERHVLVEVVESI